MDTNKRKRLSVVLHELEPGEDPRDALNWVQRELEAIDRLISAEIEKLKTNTR